MRKFLLLTMSVTLFSLCGTAAAGCSASSTLPNTPLNFYNHFLGNYTVYLTPTLSAVADGQDHSGYPFYEKTWAGSCPAGLDGSCIEFTVYPDNADFSPAGIMQRIKKYNHGRPNRGEVRIITDSSESNYVYTTDHEGTFCGPYPVPNA